MNFVFALIKSWLYIVNENVPNPYFFSLSITRGGLAAVDYT